MKKIEFYCDAPNSDIFPWLFDRKEMDKPSEPLSIDLTNIRSSDTRALLTDIEENQGKTVICFVHLPKLEGSREITGTIGAFCLNSVNETIDMTIDDIQHIVLPLFRNSEF